MSLNLSPEIENVVRERAAAEGVSVDELLARTFAPPGTKAVFDAHIDPIRDPKAHVQALLAKWQAQDTIPLMPPVLTLPGETHTEALFRKWAEEAAHMTEAEREAEDRLWEDFQMGINEERVKTGMRTLF